MASVYAIFKCEEDGKVFKVSSGGAAGGPYLKQYDGTEYNFLQELEAVNTKGKNTRTFISEAVEEGMEKAAQIYSECESIDFEVQELDSRIRGRNFN